jgi:hypothetical protein
MAGVAVVALHAAAFGVPAVRALGVLTVVGCTVLALVGSRAVAARPLDHPLRVALALLAVWLPSEFGLVHGLPLPTGVPAGLEVGRLLLLDLGLALLIVVAPLPHVGYTFRLGRRDFAAAGIALAAFAAVAIPLGLGIGFIHWGPKPFEPLVWAQRALGIYFLTAVPEELLFRGGVQNLLEKCWRGRGARIGSLLAAAVIFGAAHLNNPPAPNLRYMLLATIAGIAYGWTWQRTRCITASALTHAAVDWIWVTSFRG